MNVLIVNTSEKTGGAAMAANRLMWALTDNGVKARMLVRDRQTDTMEVSAVPQSPLLKWHFLRERATIFLHNHLSRKRLFWVDIANSGTDITRLPEFEWADVIHIHWVNQGFLSLNDLEKILLSGKRVVWTMHDMWPFTGICHHAEECTRYEEHCHDCPLLVGSGRKDLSYQVFRRKKELYQMINRIHFVGCSEWICQLARRSALLKGVHSSDVNGNIPPCKVTHIPNTLNQSIFRPMDKMSAREALGLPRDKHLVLFSSLKVTDKRKGIDYLIEACQLLQQQRASLASQIGIVVVGLQADAMQGLFPFPIHCIDYIHNEARMAQLYAAIDTFVTPSLQENLPNTIMEAMSVGTPCVGFEIGGIPEMIHHLENGYVARYKDAGDLAEGIAYVLDEDNWKRLSQSAAHFAATHYNPGHIARQYIEVYRS